MYLSNVSWNWIKQRPQYIAEGLTKFFQVDVFFEKTYKNVVKTPACNVVLNEIFRLPFVRFSFIRYINRFIKKYVLCKVVGNYDIIWVANVDMYRCVASKISDKQMVIYDCMDDLLEFPYVKASLKIKENYIFWENQLIARCDVIFASSKYLSNVLNKRQKFDILDKIRVVNNAISSQSINVLTQNHMITKNKDDMLHIVYIGTISHWFDFGLLLTSLNIFSEIVYDLYGPVDIDIPKHPRIIYHGILSHDQIFCVICEADMLVMPFKIEPIVLSVNPVKLYEYIASSRPVVSVRYSETESFEKFVNLYSTEKEYLEIIKALINGTIFYEKSSEKIAKFIYDNLWESRIRLIFTEIFTNSTKEKGA